MRLGFDRDRKHVRNVVGVDGDQAHRALALERAEPLLDAARSAGRSGCCWTLTAIRSPSCASLVALARDRELLAELLLVDRHEPPAAARQRAEDAERAGLGLVDDLDDAAGVADVVVAGFPRRAAARGRRRRRPRRAAPCAAWRCGFSAPGRARPRPIRSGVAISSPSLSRPVMSASVTSGRLPGWCSFLRLDFDVAFVGQLAQHALQLDAAVVLQIEGAGDLARADLAGLFADEGEDLFLAGKGNAFGWMFEPMNCLTMS